MYYIVVVIENGVVLDMRFRAKLSCYNENYATPDVDIVSFKS